MKRNDLAFGIFTIIIGAILAFLLISYCDRAVAENYFTTQSSYETCFTPGENCTNFIVGNILGAKKSIYLQAYSFTSMPIAEALVKAQKNGVNVNIIIDKRQRTNGLSVYKYLHDNQIPMWIDYIPAIAHSKVIILDGKSVITGSFNFTKAAQTKNSENIVLIHDDSLAYRYMMHWSERKLVSCQKNCPWSNTNL